MSQQNIETQNVDETQDFDTWVNSIGDFARLPATNGESQTYEFSTDKSKRELVKRDFKDPQTGQVTTTLKARYRVIVIDSPDQSEKMLDCPKTLAQAIEANLAKGHTSLEITRKGTGVNTRYSVVAA
jgi:hypothetical protein